MTLLEKKTETQVLSLRAIWEIIKYPVLLLLIFRIGLSFWFALIGLLIDPYIPATEEWIKNGYVLFPSAPTIIERIFLDVWLRWDAVHFLSIAANGYPTSNPFYFAFYPLFPILVKALSSFLQYFNYPINVLAFSGLFVSTVATGFSLINLRLLILESFHRLDLANWTLVVWVAFPTGFFLFAPYSDALYISLAIASLVSLKRKRFIIAGSLALLAGLTRAQGILLFLPIVLESFGFLKESAISKHFQWNKTLVIFSSLVLAPLGWLIFFMWTRQQASTDVFSTYASFWNSTIADPITVLIHSVKLVFQFPNLRSFAELLNVIIFGFLIVWMILRQEYRNERALLGYTIITFLSFVVWYPKSESGYLSSNRYVLSLFPAFIAYADIVLKLPNRVRNHLVFFSLVLLMLSSVLGLTQLVPG